MAGKGSDIRWLAVDFANTTACPACQAEDALATTRAARQWVRRRLPGASGRLSAPELLSLREFRDQLVELFDAVARRRPPTRATVAAINRAASGARPYPQLVWTARGWVVAHQGGDRRSARRLSTLVAHSAIDLLGVPRAAPIRQCSGTGCVHFLVAPTRAQRWCSPTGCGNRARVQRHYRKVRASRRHRLPSSE